MLSHSLPSQLWKIVLSKMHVGVYNGTIDRIVYEFYLANSRANRSPDPSILIGPI